MSKPLKAYSVTEDREGYGAVVFATNSAAARREGASELNTDWECIQSCVRAPDFDQYAPGPVPPLTLIAHGWWFECSYCGRRVSDEMADDLIDDGLNPDDFAPRANGQHGVFCSDGCECAAHMAQRGREEAADALREVFEDKFPGAAITHLHTYSGPALESGKQGRFVVTFTFPGALYSSQWDFGDDFCRVPQIDVDAYSAWRAAA